jgi:asparagine synthetase B (glutamine-hydrolysing)
MIFLNRRTANSIRKDIFHETIKCIRPQDSKIGIYISGGIDSSILLANLVEISKVLNFKVVALSADFGIKKDECAYQKNIAKYYGVDFIRVPIEKLYIGLPEILSIFDRPQFNVWPFFLAVKSISQDITNVFVGEGADEIFGGYHAKGYREAWVDSIEYIQRAYNVIHDFFGIEVSMPYANLDWRKYLNVHCSPYKYALRKAFKGTLPDFIMHQESAPPLYTEYLEIWQREFAPYVAWTIPRTNEEARKAMRIEMAYLWSVQKKQSESSYSIKETKDG